MKDCSVHVKDSFGADFFELMLVFEIFIDFAHSYSNFKPLIASQWIYLI